MRNRVPSLKTMTSDELHKLAIKIDAELRSRTGGLILDKESFLNSGVATYMHHAFPTDAYVIAAFFNKRWTSETSSPEQLDMLSKAISNVTVETWNDGAKTYLKLKNGGLLKWDPGRCQTYVLENGEMPWH